MAMNGYIGDRKQKFVYRKTNVVDLLKRNKLEEKRKTLLIATATITSLAIVVLVILL